MDAGSGGGGGGGITATTKAKTQQQLRQRQREVTVTLQKHNRLKALQKKQAEVRSRVCLQLSSASDTVAFALRFRSPFEPRRTAILTWSDACALRLLV